METHRIQLNLALILLLLNSVLTQKTVPLSSDSERSALIDLRSTLGLRAKDWPRKADPCSAWTGINCNNGRVVGINVSGLNRTHAGRKNPRFSVDSLVNFAHLASFNSSGFSLPGSIPYWFGQRLSSLQVLDLSSCSITGSIPVSFGNLSRLNSLYLSDNFLTGAIPSTLSQSSNLSTINVSQNSLTGAIPAALSALHGLSSLDLSSNLLSGPIPPDLGLLSDLQFLNLRNNSLTSSIPAQLGNLSHLIELDLGLNDLSGSLTEELRGLRSLQKISVQNNSLSGPLPRNLFLNLNQVQYVILSSNKFNGSLLDVLQSMPQLLFLDISGNEFTGVLPDITETFNATNATFHLSDNYFEGPANSSNGNNVVVTKNCILNLPNQRSLQDCEMFYTNRGLTFEDHATPDTMLSPMPKPASNQRRRITYLVGGLFGGLGFIVLLVVMLLLLLKTCGKQSTNQSAAKMGPVPGSSSPRLKTINSSGLGVSFTYEQMLQATGDFSDTSLIKHGQSGDLFYGTLKSGFPVVIKRVDLLAFGKETYMLELDIFSLLSHPRLVPLLGHCLEHENEKLLVYKYMPLKDLSNSLYKTPAVDDDGLQSLDWITRSKIAIGAAEALSYLHHECNPPIVHRDVQASSILLDDKYEVRLGSLSEARAQGVDDQHNVITRLLRVPQNSRQGPSGSSTAACAYDVYCFGKVLLELVTGKLGFSQTDDVNTKEWLDQNLPYISIHEKEPVSKIVDESLILDEDLLDEVWAMAIVAKSCLNPKPSKRPLMRHVLRGLENPWKVIREENYNSGHLKASSSIRSWSFAFFGSWHHSSSESANQEHISVFKQSNRAGSRGSGTNEHSSSHKRSSSDVFPEPIDTQDVERQDQN